MNAKRLFVAIFATTISWLSVQAQISKEIMQVLDRYAQTVKSSGDIKAQFEAAQFENKEERGSSKGYICISGKKLFIDNGNAKIWFDGKTQWTYIADNNEVNITEPTPAERSQMNPYSFMTLYKSGYAATMTSETVRGESCYCVNLTATKPAAMPAVLLTISKNTMLPICIRTKTGTGKWTRISIYSLEKRQRFGSNTFRFNSADYPNAEIIDLR